MQQTARKRKLKVTINPFLAPLPCREYNTRSKMHSKGSTIEKNCLNMHNIEARKNPHYQKLNQQNDLHIPESNPTVCITNPNKRADNTFLPLKEQSTVFLSMLTPNTVKLKTGFHDIVQLLRYSAICYCKKLDKIAQLGTKLDWLEELELYYEFTYA